MKTLTAAQIIAKYSSPQICAQALDDVLPMLAIYTANQEPLRIGMHFRCMYFEDDETHLIYDYFYQNVYGAQTGLQYNVARKIDQTLRTMLSGADLWDSPDKYQVGDFPYAGAIIRAGRIYCASGRNQRMDETMCTAWYNQELHLCEQKLLPNEMCRPYKQDMDGHRGITKMLTD